MTETGTGARARIDSQARDRALAAAASLPVEPTGEVVFRSYGRVLVVGPLEQATELAAEWIHTDLRPAVLAFESPRPLPSAVPVPVLFSGGRDVSVVGHLGAFRVIVQGEDGATDVAAALDRNCQQLDLVVDLGQPPLLRQEVPPLGYFPAADGDAREHLRQQLPQMVGEFVKPRYFHYVADVCAHGRSGLAGCRRCLEACPTEAIVSLGERIQVDPNLCQGAGICATACPTGAISYSYPNRHDVGNRLRALLRAYREAGGLQAVLVLHDAETGGEFLQRAAASLPPNLIAIEIEELGSVGPEIWLSCLAYGAARVLLLDAGNVPRSVHMELRSQLAIVETILEGLGYPRQAVAIVAPSDGEDLVRVASRLTMPALAPAGFAIPDGKREALFLAIDHLVSQGPVDQSRAIELGRGAPLGEILVDGSSCTLCMSCVSVCPARALADGVDQPLLALIEKNCVQCGLCETACPEHAITLHPRLLLDTQARGRPRTLHREAPFNCIVCGKPFATASIIERMTQKLSGHQMFQGGDALRRLQMCGDCRVKDLFQTERSKTTPL